MASNASVAIIYDAKVKEKKVIKIHTHAYNATINIIWDIQP